jgi:hypothetical protein
MVEVLIKERFSNAEVFGLDDISLLNLIRKIAQTTGHWGFLAQTLLSGKHYVVAYSDQEDAIKDLAKSYPDATIVAAKMKTYDPTAEQVMIIDRQNNLHELSQVSKIIKSISGAETIYNLVVLRPNC